VFKPTFHFKFERMHSPHCHLTKNTNFNFHTVVQTAEIVFSWHLQKLVSNLFTTIHTVYQI